MSRLPESIVEQDHALEKATESSSLALMQHRWHWTLDESNRERVPLREYARQVGRGEKLIREYAHGFVVHASSGRRMSPADARKRALMTLETEAATEAVAEARGVQFGYASKEFGSEARNIREQARQRAEEKGTSTLAEIPQAAAITYKRQQAERERDEQRATRQPLRYIEIEAALTAAQRDLIKAIRASEGIELPGEYREMLRETLASIKRLTLIADRALIDAYDKSWQREFHVLEGGLAAS